jgi:hypothetical protein
MEAMYNNPMYNDFPLFILTGLVSLSYVQPSKQEIFQISASLDSLLPSLRSSKIDVHSILPHDAPL